MNNHSNRKKLYDQLYRIQIGEYCLYCGAFSDTYDHFMPLWYVEILKETEQSIPTKLMIKVPCCRECNSIAGIIVFKTIGQKRRYIQKKLRKKYKRYLSIPKWTEEEILALDYNMRTCILNGTQMQQKIMSRITWKNSRKDFYRLTAVVNPIILTLPATESVLIFETENTMSTTNGQAASESKRNRRTILENDVALLEQLQAVSQDGPINFRELKPEQKLALLPTANPRLIRFKLVSMTYDPDTYAPLTVIINDEEVAKFADDIAAASDPKIINKARVASGEPALRKPRSVLADDKYKLNTLAMANPRRPDTLGYFNWAFYEDGQTVADYLNKPQTNESRLWVTSKGKWYDGPSTTYLYEDIKSSQVGIYDSSLPGDPVYLTMDHIEQLIADHKANKIETNGETESETETEQLNA